MTLLGMTLGLSKDEVEDGAVGAALGLLERLLERVLERLLEVSFKLAGAARSARMTGSKVKSISKLAETRSHRKGEQPVTQVGVHLESASTSDPAAEQV